MSESEQQAVAGFFTAADVRPLVFDRLELTLKPIRKRRKKFRYQTVADVHEARVEIRRARAAIDLFAPVLRSRQADLLERALRQIGQALGPIRDLDVLVEGSFNWDLRRKGESLVQFTYRVAEHRASLSSDALVNLSDSPSPKQYRPSRAFFKKRLVSGEEWRKVLERRVQEVLLSLESPLESDVERDVASMERLHERRKCCRQLRYQLEFLQRETGQDLAVKFFREAQSVLGRVQDAAIIVQRLNSAWGEWAGQKLKTEILGRQAEGLTAALKQFASLWNGDQGWQRARDLVRSGLGFQTSQAS